MMTPIQGNELYSIFPSKQKRKHEEIEEDIPVEVINNTFQSVELNNKKIKAFQMPPFESVLALCNNNKWAEAESYLGEMLKICEQVTVIVPSHYWSTLGLIKIRLLKPFEAIYCYTNAFGLMQSHHDRYFFYLGMARIKINDKNHIAAEKFLLSAKLEIDQISNRAEEMIQLHSTIYPELVAFQSFLENLLLSQKK